MQSEHFIIVFLVAAAAGVAVGYFLHRCQPGKSAGVVQERQEGRDGNMEKLRTMLEDRERITNDDVEEELDVSDATATRYLQALEDEGVLEQVGEGGAGVYYIKR